MKKLIFALSLGIPSLFFTSNVQAGLTIPVGLTKSDSFIFNTSSEDCL
ncbi:hypothetical protein NQ683_03845 [Acinetobacter baumannii]|nr:hypothetical protein [Acinetobacter baumannii]